jgi:phage N-6-adenine-methyltransferase
MNRDLLFSSATEEWSTPDDFYQELHKEFQFELDPAATKENAKCPRYFTKETNGLAQEWAPLRTFCNPPYGRGVTGKWVEKAHQEWLRSATVVLLLPARTDTKWFHDFILGKAEVRFVRGRLKFGDSPNSAPFPSMVVVYRKQPYELKVAR